MVSNFFEEIYAKADGDDSAVPWQRAISRQIMANWFETFDPAPHHKALVVAAGLGDDAAQLANLGLEVTAFDSSPTAVEWAKTRHPGAKVNWQVADLFDPPPSWLGAFDLVIEVFTIQSIEPARQAEAANAIKSFVQPNGKLVAVTFVHDGTKEPTGPPWPLHPETVASLKTSYANVEMQEQLLENSVSLQLLQLAN